MTTMTDPMLRLQGLTKAFGAVTAVDGVTLDIPRGQMVGILGPSGAGKSTLLRLVNRLIEPTSGTIAFGGTDVTRLRRQALRDWRQSAAMIFQQFNLVPRLDVLTNVLLGSLNTHATLATLLMRFRDAERIGAIRALHRLGLIGQALQRVETLSGGQMQRVAIARALLQRPKLVLADEPIASLDPLNADLVMDALRTINREDGITILCNLHALEIAGRYCDRIIGMHAGRVVFDGPPGRLTEDARDAIYGRSTRAVPSSCARDAASPPPVRIAAIG
jgi:phosphonate transport system ATP-binding protein